MQNTKHKWYDVIVAWANGEKIQVKSTKGNDTFEDYVEHKTLTPDFSSNLWEWRIKPKTVTKRYRMALVNKGDCGLPVKEPYVKTVDVTCSTLDDPIEYSVQGFIRWVGDAVEVEVEV